MVNICVAYTKPVNPIGALPTLTPAQVWAGLRRKVWRPQEFIKVITHCEVLEEESETRITRRVQFVKDDNLLPPEAVEFVTLYAPMKTEFRTDSGNLVCNLISVGPEGDVYLTYTFEWQYPDIQAGSMEEELKRREWMVVAQKGVHGTIEAMRQLARDGQLDG